MYLLRGVCVRMRDGYLTMKTDKIEALAKARGGAK